MTPRQSRVRDLLPGVTVAALGWLVLQSPLEHTHRGVPGHVVILLPRELVAILVRVPLQGARQQVVNFLVRHLEAPALVFRELDGNRLRATVQEDVPAVRMTLHALVVGDAQLRHRWTLSSRRLFRKLKS